MNFNTYSKTVAIMCDDLPGFDRSEAERLRDFLAKAGWRPYLASVEHLAELRDLRRRAPILVLPQCRCTPARLMKPLTEYVGRGGSLVTLGGPLFYDHIALEDGKYIKKELDENLLDATFMEEYGGFLLEGFAPSYKVFKHKIDAFGGKYDCICPIPRNFGAGHFDRRNRFIPLACDSDGNSAAFMMLTSYAYGGHDGLVPRPGYVMPTTLCRASAGIGILRPDLLSVEGVGETLLEILARLERGAYLFESGIDAFRPHSGETVKLGASVMNATYDYASVTLEFSVNGTTVFAKPVCAPPRVLSKVERDICVDELVKLGNTLTCRIVEDGEILDEITQELALKPEISPRDDEFVTVRDGKFYLEGREWQLVGMNYWPSVNPSFEVLDYWRGWLDPASYDPKTVELDLSRMENQGINCLLTRLDNLDLAGARKTLADFIERMRVHKMKLVLAVPLIESPPNYQPAAFRELIELCELEGEPVLMAHDVSWEVGMHLLNGFIDSWILPWNEWVKASYGSFEAAFADWSFELPIEGGILAVPTHEHMKTDGEHRVMVAAFRRFADDYLGRVWLDAVEDMRSVDPRHLYTYRQGPSSFYDCTYSATHAATDFVCPEGYHIPSSEEGYANACFSTEFLRTLSKGQPIVWAEYGKSLCGLRWTQLVWNHEGFGFYDEKLVEMTDYLSIFHRMLLATHSEGSAPWWWCGGFRRTEMSDFGYCSPAGELRPCAVEYYEAAKKLLESSRRTPERYITVDRDADARGNQYICDTVGTQEWFKAEADGVYLGVKLDGEGLDTSTLPKVAVGNVPFNGKNPHKYVNSLAKSARVEDGKLRVEFVSTGVAKWLGSNCCVKLVGEGYEALVPIDGDVERLEVASATFEGAPAGKLTAVMYTESVGDFGEKLTFEI